MPVTVRPATPDEEALVRALVRDAGLPLDGLDTAALVLVATDEDARLMGTAALEQHDNGTGAVFLLRSVAVTPTGRGLGVGTALTEAALAYADAHAAPVALLTETADGYFPRFGFDPVGRDALPDALHGSVELQGACPVTAHALLRNGPAKA